MIRLLQSKWAALLAGVVSYVITTACVWRWPAPPAPPPQEMHNNLPSWEFKNPEMDQLVTELKAEKEAVNQRAKLLDDLAVRLQTERLELMAITQNVERLQKAFDRNVVRIREEEPANLKKLAKVYAAMTPDNAAIILKEMTDDTVVKILLFMKEAETAPILENLAKAGGLDAKRAAKISDHLRLSTSRDAVTKPKTP
jgi:flagellar motility protein MotE (MotC chaperone)